MLPQVENPIPGLRKQIAQSTGMSQVWRDTPTVSATQEVEAKGSHASMILRSGWTITVRGMS